MEGAYGSRRHGPGPTRDTPAMEPVDRHPVARPYAGTADLVAMQAALSTSWILARPFSNTTVGDLEWWQAFATPEDDWTRQIRVWEVNGEVVGYAWFHAPGEIDWHQRADVPSSIRAILVEEALGWADGLARETEAAGGTPAPEGLRTWAMDEDTELRTLLERHGFTAAATPAYTQWYRRLDDEPPVPVVPAGYSLRNVSLPEDLQARVEAHRAAFAPSRMSTAIYEAVRTRPHYDPSRDIVAVAPDGSIAAFAILWWDPVARMGEFEPVGTQPAHRGLGLAKAVLHEGQRRLRDLGAADAVVLSGSDNPASEALYASAGFEAVTQHRAWTRPIG